MPKLTKGKGQSAYPKDDHNNNTARLHMGDPDPDKGHNESMLWTRLLTSQSLSPIYRPLPMLVTPRKEKLTFLAALSG